MLFDREILLMNFDSGNIPEALLRCLLAFSSILAPREKQPSNNASIEHSFDDELPSNSPVDDVFPSDMLTTETNKDILLRGLSSSVESLQASFHLSIYWFARGHLNRARSTAGKNLCPHRKGPDLTDDCGH